LGPTATTTVNSPFDSDPTSTFINTSTATAAESSTYSNGNNYDSFEPKGGLTSGSIAGIAIGIIIFVIFAISLIYFFFWRQKRRRRLDRDAEEFLQAPPNVHELMTKHNVHEMTEEEGMVVKKSSGIEDIAERRKTQPAIVLELPSNTKHTSIDTNNFAYWPVRTSELESPDSQPQASSTSPQQGTQSAPPLPARPTDVPDAPSGNQADEEVAGRKSEKEDDEKLKVLRDRIERIREEKERLERLQHLKDLEEQTKQEIMEAQRRSTNG
jgi:hypothetical protein